MLDRFLLWRKSAAVKSEQHVPDVAYRCPQDLAVTPTALRRVLLIGSCLASSWPKTVSMAKPGCPVDFFLFNNATQLPEHPPRPPEEYDFQIVQIPLRTVLPDYKYFRVPHMDTSFHEALLEDAKQRLVQALTQAMRWNREHSILTFVCNFFLPQQNPMGRLLPRYDIRNFVHFVERLNQALAEELGKYDNAHFFDIDQIASTYGRKYVQDDVIFQSNHGSAFSNADFARDQGRLEPVVPPNKVYRVHIYDNMLHIWAELVAMYRTIRQVDSVKLVVVDLDDTLWRGVAAEQADSDGEAIEGWPVGIHDALDYLRRRGVLLAIVSKNDENRIRELWPKIVGPNKLRLEDFATRKINWRPKAENLEEILREVNLLPKSVLFIDDNPVERESIKQAFPEVRVMGSNPYLWRRILLWSAETQVVKISAESAARTDMVRAQVERETERQQLSRDDFLASLSLEVSVRKLRGRKDPKFPRALELINKTNQFNTTGKRWTEQECVVAFDAGKKFYIFDVKDKFTAYGTVGVVVVQSGQVEQFVMSCRVAGMDVELAAMAEIMNDMVKDGHDPVTAAFVETELNLLCRDFYQRCGFQSSGDAWQRPLKPLLEKPAHVTMVDKISD